MRCVSLVLSALILAACSSSSPSGTTSSTGTSGSTTSASSTTGAASTSSGAAATTGTTSSGGTTSGATSSSSGGLTVGAACNPSAATDPCAATGLACESNNYVGSVQDGGQGGNCELPVELQGCVGSVGCGDPSLTCTSLLIGASACVRDCADDSDCPLPYTACSGELTGGTKICFYNFCGNSPPQIAQDVPYYSACAASDAGAGTCVPLSNPQYGTVGLCLESGTAPDGGACASFRDGGIPTECGVGQACDGLLLGQINGECRQVCSYDNDGGPACPTGQVCANSETLQVPSNLEWGVCMTPCSASNACAVGTCLAVSSVTQGVCFP